MTTRPSCSLLPPKGCARSAATHLVRSRGIRTGGILRRRSMSLVVDSHQHFWTYGTYQTSWMEAPPYASDSAFQPLRRSFEPDDLAPELQAAGVGYTVAIEAADGLRENEALLSSAHSHDWIAGVVGWVPLAHPAEVERALEACAD